MLNHSPAIKQCHETLPRNKTKGFRAMKHLLIMRHAEAGNSMNPNLRDFDRPLTAHGQNQCAMQRQRLIAQNLYPDLILHSSALRTQQTAQLVAPHQDSKRIASDDLRQRVALLPPGEPEQSSLFPGIGADDRRRVLAGAPALEQKSNSNLCL
jgi:hypothetical protein